MKERKLIPTLLVIAILAALSFGQIAFAATQPFNFKCRTKILRDEQVRYENRLYNYSFLVQVLSDTAGYKSELSLNRRPFVTAEPGEKYSIVLHNPLPIRVAVNLTIDGISSINGKPCKPADGSKWVYEQNPVYEYTRKTNPFSEMFGLKKEAGAGLNSPAVQDSCREKEMKAGTGMGERESNPIEQVYFNYNTGMYKPHQAVIIYYDFAKVPTPPQPFLSMNFAPEM